MFRYSNIKCKMSNFIKVKLLLERTSFLSKWAVMEIDLLDNAYTNRDFEYLKSKSLDVCNASSFETKQQKGFHEEHFSCSWSSENSPQGGGKCNRWNIDLWKSTGKVSMSKMLWWNKQFHFGIEIVLSQTNLEGWMVGVWDGDGWDPSQRFWGLEWSSQQNPNKWDVGRCSIKLPAGGAV